ncbi:chymotrypsin-1-like [Anoplolepis gracilipes]|uniref:chymotrypsin-1-like n=1 Tax=Anoplolepis gracilipes TaxID=354296 RepID=UPI003B9ED21F
MRQLTCILIALAVVGVYADEPERIVNGIPTAIEHHPHAVSLRTDGQHICGGSIINSRYILTAAHCVQPLVNDARKRQALTVVTGTTLLNQGGQVHKVSRMWYHENFDMKHLNSDIGLLELTAPIVFNNKQQPIRLPTTGLQKNEDLTLVAWGATNFLQSVHNDLRKLNVRYMPASDCQRFHRSLRINPDEFCTLASTGRGACNGDSGSGVIRNSDGTIVGLVSRGIPCARGFPDVFTYVVKFLSWIQQKMAQ